jgi:hypothetical protein
MANLLDGHVRLHVLVKPLKVSPNNPGFLGGDEDVKDIKATKMKSLVYVFIF